MEKSRSRITSASALAGTGLSLVIKVVVGVPPKLVDVHFFLFRRFVILNKITQLVHNRYEQPKSWSDTLYLKGLKHLYRLHKAQ